MAIPNPTHEWRGALLVQLGATVSPANLQSLALWAAAEGMPAYINNPLATTEPWPGSRTWNSAGVRIYPNAEAGILALAKTLKLPYYSAVVSAFRAGNDMARIWRAINQSPWCRGCQGGLYPAPLHDRVQSGPPAPGGGTATPVHAPPPVPHAHERGWDYSETVHNTAATIASHAELMHAVARRIRAAALRSTGLH